jgi:hypothetical protein
MKPFLINVTKVSAMLFAVLMIAPNVHAQSSASANRENIPFNLLKTHDLDNKNAITDVESFRNWLKDNLKNQLAELDKKGSGEIIIGFAIDEKGNLTNIKIIDSSDPEVNKVVLKLLCNSPQWKVKQVQNQAYKIYYSVPIKYNVN